MVNTHSKIKNSLWYFTLRLGSESKITTTKLAKIKIRTAKSKFFEALSLCSNTMLANRALVGNFIMVRGFVEFSGSNEIFQENSIRICSFKHFSKIIPLPNHCLAKIFLKKDLI